MSSFRSFFRRGLVGGGARRSRSGRSLSGRRKAPLRSSSRQPSRASVRPNAVRPSVSRQATATIAVAPGRGKKPRLKIRAGTADTVAPTRTGDVPRVAAAIRLASGTEKTTVQSAAGGRDTGEKNTPDSKALTRQAPAAQPVPAAALRGDDTATPATPQRSSRRPTTPYAPTPVAGTEAPAAAAETSAVQTIDIRPAGTVVSRRPLPERRQPVVHLPTETVPRHRPPAWMLEECQVAPARAGDQAEILQLLAGLPSPPTKAEFHAAVDHPDHDSANRLIARLAGRIVGHVEVLPRNVRVGSVTVPAAVVDRLAVLPECRGAGHGQRLVRAAEERMRTLGAAVALTRTRIAPSLRELGWSVLGRDCATPGRPTGILARLLEGPARDGEPVTMRQWRHVELPAILRIYMQNTARFVGPLDRSEAYSRWLVSRGAFDSIIVALVGQDRYDLHETSARIVGYCVQSGNRVLELLADPEFQGLEREILARVCAEAIENDRQEIVYESSVADPLHHAVAGGESLVTPNDRMIVARVFRPLELMTALAPQVAENVAAAGLRETVELGLDAPGFRGSVIVADGRATVHAGRVGRSYLRLTDDELARLLLGQSDPLEATAAGRMEASTQVAQKLATQLFPRVPLWCPMWDDLPA
jgi:GNAT superfamily N-acetyltransferase